VLHHPDNFLRVRGRSFLLSVTVDFPDDVEYGVYTRGLLDRMMILFKQIGVRRIYWLYDGDIDHESEWAGTLFDYMEYGRQTLNNIGEPVKSAVPIAHKHGLEFYAVLKPYHTGLSGTYPEGSSRANATRIKRIGGTLQQVIPFIERNPGLRIRRRPLKAPPDLHSQPIKRIRLIKKDATATRVGQENLEIWTSPNNYGYRKRNIPFTVQQAIEPAPREVRDYYGDTVTAKGAPVSTLTIEGLNLNERYTLITTNFRDEKGDFQNTALGMLEVYGPGPEPLPIVVANRSAIWDTPRSFLTGGLEFDSGYGPFQVQLDIDNNSRGGSDWWRPQGGCIAFARGKNEYLPCAPCEVYPEVTKLWMGWIDRLIESGVDGVDLRISSHGTLTDEPFEYGFNDPIIEEYSRRHASNIFSDDSEADHLAHLRGRHYTSFLTAASKRLRNAGKKMQVHIHTEAFGSNPCHGQLMGIPANIRFDWKNWLKDGLVDGVTLRTSWFEAMEDPFQSAPKRSCLSHALADPLVGEALQLSNALGLPVYLNRYVSRAVGIKEYVTDLERIFHDERFAGFDIYELAYLARPSPDGSRLEAVGDRIDYIKAKAKELGIL
jgi:hypothetical protein